MNHNPHNNFEELMESAKRVALSREEKEGVRGALLTYMAENPLPEKQTYSREEWSWSFARLIMSKRSFQYYVPISLLLLVFISGGGVSLASRGALPGDTLYPIKVKFNEEMIGILSFSPDSKIAWQNERVNRRLEEVEKLAAEGKLDSSRSVVVQEEFIAQANNVAGTIETLAKNNQLEAAANVTSNLESSLSAHGTILGKLSNALESERANQEEVHSVRGSVEDALGQVAVARTTLEAKLSAKAKISKEAAEQKLKVAEKTLAAVKGTLEKTKGSLAIQTVSDASAKLKIADEVFLESRSKFKSKAYGDAFLLSQQATRGANEAKIMIAVNKAVENKLVVTPVDTMTMTAPEDPAATGGVPAALSPEKGGASSETTLFMAKEAPKPMPPATSSPKVNDDADQNMRSTVTPVAPTSSAEANLKLEATTTTKTRSTFKLKIDL